MAKSKTSKPAAAEGTSASSSKSTPAIAEQKNATTSSPEPASLSTLSICRNKHWRFISSFHGPWLQLPQELLESLAVGNYFSIRPHIIDAAAFFDVVRIRRLIDEATNLSVRAVNGTSGNALSTHLDAGHGRRRGGGGITNLSVERRFRMRELAVRKLSEAYHLDEVAASVATMQSASSLEDVAKMVLQRTPNDPHAKYVHFFHEKIPSRALAESTSLIPLNEILQDSTTDAAVLRTRALTRIFKEEYILAAKDLTEALSNIRRDVSQHIVPITANKDVNYDTPKLTDDQKPTGIEAQLYFQRAGVFLSLACQFVPTALKAKLIPTDATDLPPPADAIDDAATATTESEAQEAYRKLKLNAKKALRDYTAFLAKLDYSPGYIPSQSSSSESATPDNKVIKMIEDVQLDSPVSDDTQPLPSSNTSTMDIPISGESTLHLKPRIYQASDLFSPTPPTNLPPFPTTSQSLVRQESKKTTYQDKMKDMAGQLEILSYHPLLTEAVHGLLLCHALLQTDKVQMKRHAYQAARLVSLSDGFPVFTAARSASRADWVDILDQTKGWLDFEMPWDQLCKITNSNRSAPAKNKRTDEQIRQKHKHEMDLDNAEKETTRTHKALQAAADALEDLPDTPTSSKTDAAWSKTKSDLKAYSLGTERAGMIADWIKNGPILPDAAPKLRKGKKKVHRPTSVPA